MKGLLVVLVLLLAGCGQKQKEPVAIKFSTSNLVNTANFPGGVMIYGRSEKGVKFALNLSSATYADRFLDVGSWDFLAIGWRNGTSRMEGLAVCDSLPTRYIDQETTIYFNLTAEKCISPEFPIDPLGLNSDGMSLVPLKVNYCLSMQSGSSGDNCLMASTRKFNVNMLHIEPIIYPSPAEFFLQTQSAGLKSTTYYSSTATSLVLPVGELPSSVEPMPFPVIISMFDSTGTYLVEKFVFKNGLINGYDVLNQDMSLTYIPFNREIQLTNNGSMLTLSLKSANNIPNIRFSKSVAINMFYSSTAVVNTIQNLSNTALTGISCNYSGTSAAPYSGLGSVTATTTIAAGGTGEISVSSLALMGPYKGAIRCYVNGLPAGFSEFAFDIQGEITSAVP